MRQSPKQKRLIPKDLTTHTDHEIMEIVLGKRVMKAVDAELSKQSDGLSPTIPKS